ncbi:hypothetical protein OG455_10295 [Kitasatospora sp. NBC_01287]|uniref:hypothetical protein n=1 Tax=Kitasatospora sp. NBC_01287 TaxID=2903573 RepID=UPI0022576930|nr:hypothetical protein [Kitasatospora sp. NBC_01287]MCX4745910.1 hypothetical protein [Kitasatospora sp. NBC_01287]
MPPTTQSRSAISYVVMDGDELSAPLFTAWCAQRAEAEGLIVTEVITDPDSLTPPAERPGWGRVMALAACGGTAMVITVNRRMIAADPREWADLAEQLADAGTALTTMAVPAAHKSTEQKNGVTA